MIAEIAVYFDDSDEMLMHIPENFAGFKIAIDPDAVPPRRNRWFELDTLLPDTRPWLATWVMRTNDIDKVTNATDLELGVVEDMNRGSLE